MTQHVYIIRDRIAACVLGVMMSPLPPEQFVTEENRRNYMQPRMDCSMLEIFEVAAINDQTGKITSIESPEYVGNYSSSIRMLENFKAEQERMQNAKQQTASQNG